MQVTVANPVLNKATLTPEQAAVRRQLHQTIQKVSHDMGVRTIFNTAIAANMELINTLSKFDDESDNAYAVRQEVLEAIVLMLTPMVPHICQQLWLELGHAEASTTLRWPTVDDTALLQDSLELMVQINGKLRSKISVAATATQEEIQALALADEQVIRFIDQQVVKKIIVVPKKLVNIVV